MSDFLQQISDMISHILTNGLLDPWSWIAILFILFTVVLPLTVIVALSILVVFLVRKLLATSRTKKELKAEGK
jgi:hypothetical protein|tara:strand:+ start:65 stop:283 length:219 start_codon:yes stop_codon:yes gene_type:complete